MKKLSYILLLFFLSCNVRYEKIISVHDGDTVTAESGERIRFAQIDAPEINQNYGVAARIFVAKLILNKTVKIVTHGKDKYGRTIGDIYINGWSNSNLIMIVQCSQSKQQYNGIFF